MRTSNISLSAWVYLESRVSDSVPSYYPYGLMRLEGQNDQGTGVKVSLDEVTAWGPGPDPNLLYFYLYFTGSGIAYSGGPPAESVSIPQRAWTLLTFSFETDQLTVYVNESISVSTKWNSMNDMYAKFTEIGFGKAYSKESRSRQEYMGIHVYDRTLEISDITARVTGNPSLCSPGPPPTPPPPPFAPSPPSPPFAPIIHAMPCVSEFTPVGAFSEACYVILPQPMIVCNGTRISIGCGADASIRVRFPYRTEIRAKPAGGCELVVDTVGSTFVQNMAIEVACTSPPCNQRPILLPTFSNTGECETVPVFEREDISWRFSPNSTARVLLPSLLQITSHSIFDDVSIYRDRVVLYQPIPELLCPGSAVYAWLPRPRSSTTWRIGCGARGVCAPVFDYPAQNASIPFNVARINGRFEARTNTVNGVMRVRLLYTGSVPLVSAPNTAIQFSTVGNDADEYYEVAEYADITEDNPDYTDYQDTRTRRHSEYLFQSIINPNFVGAFVEGPSTCETIDNQSAWCVPQPGVTTCAKVCAGSHVHVAADGLSADTVLIVFGVVRLTIDSPTWNGVTIGNTTAEVECAGTCGMAALSLSWTNPSGGCPAATKDGSPSDRFPCAWNAMAIHGTPASLCNVTVEEGQIVELWVDYVSFHDVAITIANETFTLRSAGFPEDDSDINPGCPYIRYSGFVNTLRLTQRGAAWSGNSRQLEAGTYDVQMHALARRAGVNTLHGCPPTDVVATVHAIIRYPDPPTSNVSTCTSSSPCVLSDTTLASVSTYAVSIQSGGLHRCGGYMAGPRTVVTAAHCAIALSEGATVVYGTTNLSSPGLSVSARVAGSIVHEAYYAVGDPSRSNDISVLMLASAFSGIDPATVSTDQPSESLAAEFGWGNGSPSLRIALVDVVSRDECVGAFGTFPESGVCMRRAGSEVVCQGDSGSPSAWIGAFSNTGDVLVRGILALPSWGAACKQGSALSIFTNLSYHAGWLDRATIASETCGGDAGCIAQITNGTWSASPIVDYAAVQQQNGSGAVLGPPPPSLQQQLDRANAGVGICPSVYVMVALAALFLI